MPLTVMMLLLTSVAQCWGASQWRSWSPQAILYLKGAQGHRLMLQRTSRAEDAASQLGSVDQPGDDVSQPSLSLLLKLLQAAVDEGRGDTEDYPSHGAPASAPF